MAVKERTAQAWLKELIGSPRFKLAMLNFEDDPQFMLAILTEVVLETREVTVSKMKSIYGKNFRSNKEVVLDLMTNYTNFVGFKSAWSLTPTELKLYMLDPKFEATKKQRSRYLNIVKNSFMNERNLPKKKKSPEE